MSCWDWERSSGGSTSHSLSSHDVSTGEHYGGLDRASRSRNRASHSPAAAASAARVAPPIAISPSLARLATARSPPPGRRKAGGPSSREVDANLSDLVGDQAKVLLAHGSDSSCCPASCLSMTRDAHSVKRLHEVIEIVWSSFYAWLAAARARTTADTTA